MFKKEKSYLAWYSVTKQQFCISCLRKKKAIWLGIIQQPVKALAGSDRTGAGFLSGASSACTI